MAFTNTVTTTAKDKTVTRSIIDRSITELNDNISVSIRQQAFRACSALANVNFPSVTSVGLGAFWQCTALSKAEFSSCVAFANNAFYGCSALTALILRCTDQICTITGTPFASSTIASGTGYIYVPAALVDQYKASWTAYATQFRAIEDYPGIDDPYSWAGVFANIDNGSYASVYKIGDLVPLDLGSEGIVNMQIAGIDKDELADGSGSAPISWVSKELLATTVMYFDDGATSYDWENSNLRRYLKENIKELMPENVINRIKEVSKQSCTAEGNVDTNEDLWVPSHAELFGIGYGMEAKGPRYTTLDSNTERKKTKINQNNSYMWFLRTCNAIGVRYIDGQGKSLGSDYTVTTEGGIALGFCT